MAKAGLLLFVSALVLVVQLVCSFQLAPRPFYRVNLANKAKEPSGDDIAADKLVYDTQNNRFYESKLSENVSPLDEYFLVDKETGDSLFLTREEKERIFLDSIQSYYYSGTQQLSDNDFKRLKADLEWEGSVLVTLNRNETLFVNAVQAYNKGSPILSDAQFDELKNFLKESNSKIAVQSEPKCYTDTGLCKITWSKDNLRQTSLYIPAALISTLGFLGVGYEALGAVGVSLNPLLALLIGSFPISVITKTITENIFFNEPLVASGACPSCGVENRIFFGDVFGVKGDRDEAGIKCTNCKTGMTIKRNTLRVSTLLSKSKQPVVASDD